MTVHGRLEVEASWLEWSGKACYALNRSQTLAGECLVDLTSGRGVTSLARLVFHYRLKGNAGWAGLAAVVGLVALAEQKEQD